MQMHGTVRLRVLHGIPSSLVDHGYGAPGPVLSTCSTRYGYGTVVDETCTVSTAVYTLQTESI